MEVTWYQILAIAGIPAICSFLFQFLFQRWYDKRRKEKDHDELLRKAMQASLRMDLLYYHDKFTVLGYIPAHYKEAYDNIYKQYHALGKNGVMGQCYKEVMNLPINPRKSIKKEAK